LVLAEVHELADGRAGHRRHLDQVQVHVGGQLESALQGDDAHLLTLRSDQPYLTGTDLLVDARLVADGASSVRPTGPRSRAGQPSPPAPTTVVGVGPKKKGSGACQSPLDRSRRAIAVACAAVLDRTRQLGAAR